jgi:hypothetical protein
MHIEFRKDVKRVKRNYRMGAISAGEVKSRLLDVFFKHFGSVPRKAKGTLVVR